MTTDGRVLSNQRIRQREKDTKLWLKCNPDDMRAKLELDLFATIRDLQRQVSEYKEAERMVHDLTASCDRIDINPYVTVDDGVCVLRWTVEVFGEDDSVAISEGKRTLSEAVKEVYGEYVARQEDTK